MTPEVLQTVLGIIAVGGIGGVWFRLGNLTAKTEAVESRVTKLEGVIYREIVNS